MKVEGGVLGEPHNAQSLSLTHTHTIPSRDCGMENKKTVYVDPLFTNNTSVVVVARLLWLCRYCMIHIYIMIDVEILWHQLGYFFCKYTDIAFSSSSRCGFHFPI